MKRRLTALLCAVVLLLGIVPARAITEADIYFVSINDNLLPLSADSMPIWVDGLIYVPASVFDSKVTGMDLGVLVERNRAQNTLALYTLRQMLVFDLRDGSCTDHSNERLNLRCVTRSGRHYLPLEAICNIFGLKDTYTYTRYGYLVRICTDAARLSDEWFIDAASEVMKSRAKEYIESQRPATPDPTPKPPAPVVPDDPVVTPPEQDQPKGRVLVYLAFLCREGEGLESILNSLDRNGAKGLFLFTPQLLAERDDLARRVIGSGHCIGLLAEGEDVRGQLTQGNQLLGHIARSATTAVWTEGELLDELEEEGWRGWNETMKALPRTNERGAAYAQRMVDAIGTRSRSVYLTLDDSTATAGVLSAALERFKSEEYTVVTPIETRI